MSADLERFKRDAALRAAGLVESGMVVGLGTGSTARYAIEAIGEHLATGSLKDIRGVPTSEESTRMGLEAGIPLVELEAGGVDLAIDGMDEVTPGLDAIKGLGAALTREKIVATSAARFVLIGDRTKRVARLGEIAPVPVEIIPFGWRRTEARLRGLGADPVRRERDGEPVVTDNGGWVFDCRFDGGLEPAAFAAACKAIPGVVEHGLFLGIAWRAFVAGEDGVDEIGGDDVGEGGDA